ncbi:DUF4126 family protein [Spirosoma sp. KNUC1025]|uniref:DUF4126 family protein n=1 Tax=Spirosoma sp. KNUC1025 TaxID=2894082 RepID=UPI0038705CD7|nr:DUF4126 family protein [Spirosoma sp. KNUC1025]
MFRTALKAFQIGLVAGMRSMTAPALVSYKLSHSTTSLPSDSRLHFLASPRATTILGIMAGGELIGDKLPNTPDRTAQPQLWGRIGSGALSGAALTEADGQPAEYGAVFGAIGAAAGTFAFFYLRQWLTHEKDLPDPLVALAEDALAIGTAWQLTHESAIPQAG